MMTKKMKLEIKIKPVITITMGKDKLGTVEFDNFKDVEKFMAQLKESIMQIIENISCDKNDTRK